MLLSHATSTSQPIMARAPTSITRTAAAHEKAFERKTKRLDFTEWSAIWKLLERIRSLPVLSGKEGDCISCSWRNGTSNSVCSYAFRRVETQVLDYDSRKLLPASVLS